MIPQAHRQEALQRAYVAAVAAQAGIRVEFSAGTEYGVDGTFRLVKEINTLAGKRTFGEHGFPLDFQLKSTVGCRYLIGRSNEISYDCDVEAYNKLVWQNATDAVPVLLIVMCLPANTEDWLHVTEEHLTLRKACYWAYVQGKVLANAMSRVIRIPRAQMFTPNGLADIMETLQANGGRL